MIRDREPEHAGEASWRELRLLCRLSRVAPSIGAGCALLAMAATEPARAIPAGGAAAFLRVTSLMDYYFRLANDLAFSDATRGDRDGKPNTFTCLLPAGLTGKAREQASAVALGTCRATAAWLELRAPGSGRDGRYRGGDRAAGGRSPIAGRHDDRRLTGALTSRGLCMQRLRPGQPRNRASLHHCQQLL